MPFAEIYYHFVLGIELGKTLHPVTAKLVDTKINGIIEDLGGQTVAHKTLNDHIHLLVAMPSLASPDDLVTEIKERSSELVSGLGRGETLEWAKGYGVVTVSNSHLELVEKYIDSQEKRHDEGKTNTTLERIEP